MEIEKALAQIQEIHGHLARSEVYRGYRSVPMAFTGMIGLLASVAQPWIVDPDSPGAFLRYWATVCVANVLVVGLDMIYDYHVHLAPRDRRMTRQVVGQFIPCLVAGAFLTMIFARGHDVALLPGLWALLFSLGAFASRPYLPRGVGWVALYYLVCGCVLLTLAQGQVSLAAWSMGASFGLGQLFLATVLYWNLERRTNG
ncbi:hypothetical protein DYH09_10600 [bacterium CPR1]|nr:hypothetical protein [bacterium CPR1]